MTRESFFESINELMTNKRLYTKAKEIATQLSNENGIENAISIIENLSIGGRLHG